MESSTKSSLEKSTESTTVSGNVPVVAANNSQKVDQEAALHPPKKQETAPETTDEAAVAKVDEEVKAEFEHDMAEESGESDSKPKSVKKKKK